MCPAICFLAIFPAKLFFGKLEVKSETLAVLFGEINESVGITGLTTLAATQTLEPDPLFPERRPRTHDSTSKPASSMADLKSSFVADLSSYSMATCP